MKWLIIPVFLLAGCMQEKPAHLEDGYQMGDLTRTAIELQNQYCNNEDIVSQALLFMLLDEIKPMTGDENLCEFDIIEFVRSR